MDSGSISLWIMKVGFWFIILLVYLGIAWMYLKIGTLVLGYVFIPAFSIFFVPNWLYLRKNQEYKPNEKHIAIVLANNYMPERISIYMMVNLPKLVKYFKKKNWPYKVYFRTDKNKLKKIINNPRVTIAYLIGHGQRHGIKVSRKEIVYYCEFQNSPKKDFIAQLHCNHYGGTSLVEYVAKDPKKSFVTDKKLKNLKLNKLIDKVVGGKMHSKP